MKEWLKIFLKKYMLDWLRKLFCKIFCSDDKCEPK